MNTASSACQQPYRKHSVIKTTNSVD